MQKRLKAILYAHRKFLEGDPEAVCADLRGINLTSADLRNRDLRQANLSRVNLEGADLRRADLSGANLSGANLHRAKLEGAKMTATVLTRAFMAFVSLDKVDLTDADLVGADLSGVLWGSATLGEEQAERLQASVCVLPEGDIIGWKRLRGGRVARLLIPKEAKRSNGFGRRCRAEYVKVLCVFDRHQKLCKDGTSLRDPKLKYVSGELVRPDKWDEDWKNECSHGINFFVTLEEAETYGDAS